MWEDPIVEEVRQAREKHAAIFNYDIDAIIRDFQEKQKKFGKKVVSFINGEYKVIEQLVEPVSK